MRLCPHITAWMALTALLALAGGTAPLPVDASEVEPVAAPKPKAVPPPGLEGIPKPIDGSGRWQKLRAHRFDANLDPEQRRMIEQLEALGYVGGSIEDGRSGITVNADDRTQPGLNFYTSGHAPEAVLMDSQGRVLHRWNYGLKQALPDYPVPPGSTSTDWWRRAHLFENGDVLAIFEGMALIKIDKDSNLLWARAITAHHDLDVLSNGDIYVLTREAHIVPSVSERKPILEDFISILDSDGIEKRRISLVEALEKSSYRNLRLNSGVDPNKVFMGDIFHTNTLEVLRGTSSAFPFFRQGNILISILKLNAIAVVDPVAEKVVWARKGHFKAQHDPTLLPNGNVMLFDNTGHRGASSVQELDPRSGRVVWKYAGTKAQPFFSLTCGTAQRLSNGNTLVTESDSGRAFELTPNRQIVWEFYNPHRAGESKEYIASLFELVRLPAAFPIDWLESAGSD